jgi:regulatory protein
MELKEAGLDDATIEQALASAPDFHAIARDLRIRRFGADAPPDWAERARQSRFLQYRGFSNDHIASALGSSPGPDELPLGDDDTS